MLKGDNSISAGQEPEFWLTEPELLKTSFSPARVCQFFTHNRKYVCIYILPSLFVFLIYILMTH